MATRSTTGRTAASGSGGGGEVFGINRHHAVTGQEMVDRKRFWMCGNLLSGFQTGHEYFELFAVDEELGTWPAAIKDGQFPYDRVVDGGPCFCF